MDYFLPWLQTADQRLLLKKLKIVAIFTIALFAIFIGQRIFHDLQAIKDEETTKLAELYINATDGLNLREEPKTSSKILQVMPYGGKVIVEEENNNWLKVEMSGKTGWCSKDYTSKEEPKRLSIREVDFSKIIPTKQGVSYLLPAEYQDYNGDGFEEALITEKTEGGNNYNKYYVYGYKDGLTFSKYLDLRPETMGKAYQNGYMGQDNLKFENNIFVLSYPLYKIDDPACCPSLGKAQLKLKWEVNKFVLSE